MRIDFADAYDDHVWDVYAFLAYRVGSRVDAEDLTQLTFERALKAWERYEPSRASVRTWLLAIARNLLVDHFRRRGREPRLPLDESGIDAAEPARAGLDAASDLSADLTTALECLSAREREVVALRFGGDLNGPEIAELLSVSLANAQQILSRALRKLRGELEREPGAARDRDGRPEPPRRTVRSRTAQRE